MNAAEPDQILDDEARLQLNPDGGLRHLLTLKGFDRDLLVSILDEAEEYVTSDDSLPARSEALAGYTVANLFFEPSTRTRASFDLAGKRLGADVLNLDVNTSSRKKGESILDTIYTLAAMRCDIMVVRDASAGVPAYIARHVKNHNNAFMMQNHGALVFGHDVERAVHNVEILEKCSLAYLLALCSEREVSKIPPEAREIAFAKLREDQSAVRESEEDPPRPRGKRPREGEEGESSAGKPPLRWCARTRSFI